MSVNESEICTEVELRVESYADPVDQIVRFHAPAVTQDGSGIWAVRCFTCGEPMLGRPEHRRELINQLRRQLLGIEP